MHAEHGILLGKEHDFGTEQAEGISNFAPALLINKEHGASVMQISVTCVASHMPLNTLSHDRSCLADN